MIRDCAFNFSTLQGILTQLLQLQLKLQLQQTKTKTPWSEGTSQYQTNGWQRHNIVIV